MIIRREHVESYLQCKHKTYLQHVGNAGNMTEYETFFRDVQRKYTSQIIQEFLQSNKNCLHAEDIEIDADILKKQYNAILNGSIVVGNFHVQVEVLQKVTIPQKLDDFLYVPLIISYKEKLTRKDKLLLTAIALLLEERLGYKVEYGKIVHGRKCTSTKVKFETFIGEASKVLLDIESCWTEHLEPPFMLNAHCKICEYHSFCKKKAIESDHLSLLGGIRDKEIKKWNNKGYFTVNQLSYAFRPRRKRKRAHNNKKPYRFELKALAIRENKVHIYEIPQPLKKTNVQIYFDVEGIPDRDFYYLIGVVVLSEKKVDEFSLWANNVHEEIDILRRFLGIIGRYKSYTLYHYGTYEITYLKRMRKKVDQHVVTTINAVMKNCCNLLTLFRSHIYLPTYTNELKEIGRYIGFNWTHIKASGIQSIVWRSKWELTKANALKETLQQYNKEDCYALVKIKKLIDSLIYEKNKSGSVTKTVYCEELENSTTYYFQIGIFSFPEMEFITKSAYFDYQRERVFVRTDKSIKQSQSQKIKKQKNRRNLKPNTRTEISARFCNICQGRNILIKKDVSKQTIDLKFFHSGVKRWVTHIDSHIYTCLDCKRTFIPEQYKHIISKYCHNLMSWTIFQNIVNKQSIRQIGRNFYELFDIVLPHTVIYEFRDYMFDYYQITYEQLYRRIVSSDILYVDETPIKLSDEDGYGWVFTNNTEVVIIYKSTREGDFLKEFLKDFSGVLVSDFYPAYDSLDCKQQKCLIHLIRDLNDDLLKHPFDVEFKEMTHDFTILLQTIVKTIDKYGLKKRHLYKHHKDVNRFFSKILTKDFTSEIAIKYKKRFKKNKEKLFEFLNHDNVSWNNTNAEHAIKLLAIHRNNTFKWFNSTKIGNYLRLISIYQTCLYNEVSFLKFLTSKEKNLIRFCQKYF
jgi:predicted RecB family nuclease